VLPANVRASALYERRGYVPTWLTLTRFGRRRETAAASVRAPIEVVARKEVDTLAPLWHSLHRHHQAVAPELGPFVSHDASWDVVRPLLAATADDGLLLRAGSADRPLAMASVSIARDDPLWADTWITGRDVAEIKLLVVDESARGSGLGSALLDAVDDRLAAAGVHDQAIGAIATNAAAISLYERRGFRPTWLQMTLFESRERGATAR
jgi:ribosomal protein S18 acetylase RimI-like enzyme